jgi:hypothetical protein
MFILKRDGKEVFKGGYLDCIKWVHDNCPYSFHHAVEHEGYSMLIISDEGVGEDNKSFS